MPTSVRLSEGVRRDYESLIEGLSYMVLEFVRQKNAAGVRRWASSLAHCGNVLLDDRAA